MEDEVSVLLIKDKDDKMCALKMDGVTNVLVNKDNLNSIQPFSQDVVNDVLKKYASNITMGQEALVIKMSFEDFLRKFPHDAENLSITNFDPKWLSEHVVDLLPYMPSKKQEAGVNNTQTYHALDEKKINKTQILQEWGLNIDSLRESGDLDKMLNYGRSRLLTCYPIIAGVCFPMQTKMSLREKNDGTLALIPHPIRKEPNLTEYRGYRFTDEDRVNLITTGNLGHTISIYGTVYGQKSEVYLSLDKETKELVAISKQAIKIPAMIKGVELTESQRKQLEDGGSVLVTGMKAVDGGVFDANLQVNAERRSIVFKNPDPRFRIGNTLLGKEITDEMKKQWESGKWIYVEDMIGKDGSRFSAYVRPNIEKGRYDFSKSIPDTQSRNLALQEKTRRDIQFLKDLENERKNGKDINDDQGRPKPGTFSHAADAKLEANAKRTKLHL